MILIAKGGTTAAGSKILKASKVKLIKDLDTVKKKSSKKSKTSKKKSGEKSNLQVEEDFLDEIPKSDLIEKGMNLVKTREPESIKVTKVKDYEEAFDVKGFSSTADLLIVYRTIEKNPVGVKEIRKFQSYLEEHENVAAGIIVPDKFTTAAKRDGQKAKITLISLKEEKETAISPEIEYLTERLIRGAIEILKYRGYKILPEKNKAYDPLRAGSEKLGKYIIAEESSEKTLVLVPQDEVVRVATVRTMKEQMDHLGISSGILIPIKRFTYTADRECQLSGIVPLRKNHPVFNIFNNGLVPEHVILDKKATREVLKKFHSKIHQIPKIFDRDPAVSMLGAKEGDLLEIRRGIDSKSYRIVIPTPGVDRVETDED